MTAPTPPSPTEEELRASVEFWLRDTLDVRQRLTIATDELTAVRELVKGLSADNGVLRVQVAELRRTLANAKTILEVTP